MNGKCDYFGCDKPLAPDQPETGMKFCQEHDAELDRIAKAEDIGALLQFWIAAQGGPEQAARRVLRR